MTFEERIAALTQPVNGQFPRPWMTDVADPLSARVFIVGRNQATGYPTTAVDHREHLDALFNRNGQTCRGMYERMRPVPSTTRRNTDALVAALHGHGVRAVLETNVICYSTPMSADLAGAEHAGGRARGTALFRTLLETIEPPVVIAHGAGTAKDLGRVIGVALPRPPAAADQPVPTRTVGGTTLLVIPSLAPPAWNRWARWAPQYFERVAALCQSLAT